MTIVGRNSICITTQGQKGGISNPNCQNNNDKDVLR